MQVSMYICVLLCERQCVCVVLHVRVHGNVYSNNFQLCVGENFWICMYKRTKIVFRLWNLTPVTVSGSSFLRKRMLSFKSTCQR